MIGRIEHFFRKLRRRFSRAEWAIPVLGLPVFEGTESEPGLMLIQIDGLSRRQMERAMERGRMPFLRRLLQQEHYETLTFYPGLPSSTPAVQGELFYGAHCAVPAFSFFDRSARKVITMFTPECAKEVEATLEKCGEGLLRGGSSWSNIYTGGAADEECHLCFSRMSFRDLFRSRPLVRVLTFPLFHFPSLLKIAALLVAEFFLAFWDLFRGVARGESFVEELKLLFKRVFVCVGLREVLTVGMKIDAARGVPVIHANFLGYDEQAHRRGPSSAFAHWSLAGIDRAIKNIYRAAQRSGRRDYQVWIFSDHGQEATQPFDKVREGGLEELISAALAGANAAARRSGRRPARSRFTGERSGHRGIPEWFRKEVLTLFEEQPFTVAAFGPVGHVYFKEAISTEKKVEVAKRLTRGGVPGVIICEKSKMVEWYHGDGEQAELASFVDSLPHPAWLKTELRRDLAGLCAHPHAGDLILLGWSPEGPGLSFANERGGHAGPGPEETQGFVILPEQTRLPNRGSGFLRPADLRAAALHYLKRQPLPYRLVPKVRSITQRLRIMTFNVHSCRGMDGRTLPRRIASVIERYDPDVVALQELDLGRVRSQRDDQPRLIAEELGMHVAFCPTVIHDCEKYGHALLSHFPMNIIRTDVLRSGKLPAHVEPRGALWVRLEVDDVLLNVMNTHFGLRRGERLAQANDLLDRNWIGAVAEDQPLVLCGDFNMSPRSEPYRALTRRLRDVQAEVKEFSPLNTFTTIRPMMRIDHVFVSRHFAPTKILVPRNQLTRVASDHLPLIVDLLYEQRVSQRVSEVVMPAASS